MLYSEFRDGNVPAGYEQLRVLRASLAHLPDSVTKLSLRSDTAGYQEELLLYCGEGRDPRFGVIDFAISADVTPAFRTAVLVSALVAAAGFPVAAVQAAATTGRPAVAAVPVAAVPVTAACPGPSRPG